MKRHWLALLLVVSGCPSRSGPPPGRTPAEQFHLSADFPVAGDPVPANDPNVSSADDDDPPIVVQLDVYLLTVPFRAISNNDDFWKRVDENKPDIGIADLLQKNGMRVGIGSNDDWSYFKHLIDQYNAVVQRGTASPAESGSLDLPMKKSIDYENVFYFNDHNELYGRTYERCENLLQVLFYAAKRHPGDSVIKVCPVIRGLRKRLEISPFNNDEREIVFVNPEQLIDLRLEVTVTANHFLIVAPSRISKWKSSLGNSFLISPGHAELVENVLLFVPHAYHLTKQRLVAPPRAAPR